VRRNTAGNAGGFGSDLTKRKENGADSAPKRGREDAHRETAWCVREGTRT
jgi:hypothetical protein